ncbi:MAG TPA: Fe-S cluster assembly protein HesB [Anaeromyxobacteraceae bacterium]|nr:Fe-S cluster assembly protein HesB [Anaeromyxobacteraceae bacterium]
MRTPVPFDLDLTVRSHGFYDLAPWCYLQEKQLLSRPFLLSNGRVVAVQVSRSGREGGLLVRAASGDRLSAAEGREVRGLVRVCLALDEDLSPFYARIRELEKDPPRAPLPALGWAARRGAGRLLRSPSVFEDAVKTLCTTNCTWALTRVMVKNLVEKLGAAAAAGARAFPTPQAMAQVGERFYRDSIRAGYRARALAALAHQVASGELDVESWRDSSLATHELAAHIRELPGFGPYATEHLLRLLGRYEHLALDSWLRQKLTRLRGRKRAASDRTIARWYAPYGPHAGLAMWLEATSDWHGDEPSWPSRPPKEA